MSSRLHSFWQDFEVPRFPAGELPSRVDVVVVGGGITGVTAALLLKQAGKRVLLVEKRHVGSGETGHTSAHLTYVTDLRLTKLIDTFGRDAAERTWKGGAMAIDLIESHAVGLGIDCGFSRVPGYLYASIDGANDESAALRNEADAAASLGFAARFVDRGPILGKPAVSFADQAVFHPLRYLAGLADAVHGDGSLVCDGAEIGEMRDDPLSIDVNGRTVQCADLIIATHVPLTGVESTAGATLLQTKLYPYSTYVVGAKLPRGQAGLPPGLYSDTSDPYYYLRVHDTDAERYAIFGGGDHKTGVASNTPERFAALERALHRILPAASVDHRWSGQVIETNDGLPFIGRSADHQFVATGYAGNGLTFGSLAGIMARDAVLGLNNPWQDLFKPTRKQLVGGLGTVVRENAEYPVHLIMDRLREDRTATPASIERGDGKVLRLDGHHVACHRDDAGKLVMVDAVCTHLGCLVRWNPAERTWDCPCHGSRFAPDGSVIGGPAEEPLEPR